MDIDIPFEVTISSLAHGGAGVARHSGTVVFVPGGVPGDRLRVRPVKIKKRHATAEIQEIVKASPKRVPPRCTGFEDGCGGCQWLHVDYSDQLHYKTANLRETLKRIGGISISVPPIVPAHPFHGCRNKFSLSRDASGNLGLCRARSREVLVLEDCRMASPELVAAYHALQKTEIPDSVYQVEIRTDGAGDLGVCMYADNAAERTADAVRSKVPGVVGVAVRTGRRGVHTFGQPTLTWTGGRLPYTVPHQSFFQTNYAQAAALTQAVARFVGDTPGGDRIIDLYCGVGLFALDLAARGADVTGVERDPAAVQAARKSARDASTGRVKFIRSDVRRYSAGMSSRRHDVVILDPPRAGCDPQVIDAVIRSEPQRIIYVSCAPDTLARDLARIGEQGYRAAELLAFDMFPQTYHMETVVRIEKDR